MFKSIIRYIIGVCLTFTLLGCAETRWGDEFSLPGPKSGTISVATYGQFDALESGIQAGILSGALTRPDATALSGSATMNGMVELQVVILGATAGKGLETFAGNLALELDFENLNVSANADGFALVSGGTSLTPVQGELIGAGKIDLAAENVGLNIPLSGNIQGENPYTFSNLGASGQLYSGTGNRLVGNGSLTGQGASTGGAKVEVSGGFVVMAE